MEENNKTCNSECGYRMKYPISCKSHDCGYITGKQSEENKICPCCGENKPELGKELCKKCSESVQQSTSDEITFTDILEDWNNGFLKDPQFYSYCKSISIEIQKKQAEIESITSIIKNFREEDSAEHYNMIRDIEEILHPE
ncbi:hypothetical protein KAR91_62890 [Candidatus Pacearchaeota archaeon]|nr:hypothetical protein [Candidatus Pacearchaeota archaeon]